MIIYDPDAEIAACDAGGLPTDADVCQTLGLKRPGAVAETRCRRPGRQSSLGKRVPPADSNASRRTARSPTAARHCCPLAGPVRSAAALGLGIACVERAFGWTALGIVYVAIPSIALIAFRQEGPEGLPIIVFVAQIVWATDIAAYFGGRAIGGPKLWPLVSPKKTWSGAATGLAGAIAVALMFTAMVGTGNWLAALLLALLLSVGAQAGDLAESAFKRRFGVKDSGTIIPGHGGVLDRVDGLYVALALAGLLAVMNAPLFLAAFHESLS